jgi:glyoxylase-like metal-dependent hydrolase (beta-lactamase superfamily II)
MDRRGFITLGAGVAGMAMLGNSAKPTHATGRLIVDDGELIVVADGSMTLPVGFSFPDVPKQEIDAVLSAAGMPPDAITNDCNVTFLRRGDRLIAFDAGAGSNFLPTTGKLLENLADTGIDPAEVTDVVFTHAHPDHLWGLTDDFDELVFPNASYRIGQAEWDFWTSPSAIDAMPEDRKTFAVGAQNRLSAIADRIAFFKPGAEVLPGVEAIDTGGHTPGHISFMVHGNGYGVLIAGDAVTNVVLSLQRPDWPAANDQDPERGVKTRLSLLDRLATDKGRVIGFHFPHPAAGIIVRHGGFYRFATA